MFGYYYRLDGELFTYPAAWGRCLGVLDDTELLQPIENFAEDEEGEGEGEDLRVRPETSYSVYGENYYIFVADDGTIRRARISDGVFDADHPRPSSVPEDVEVFHYWSVDVLPREAGKSSRD